MIAERLWDTKIVDPSSGSASLEDRQTDRGRATETERQRNRETERQRDRDLNAEQRKSSVTIISRANLMAIEATKYIDYFFKGHYRPNIWYLQKGGKIH